MTLSGEITGTVAALWRYPLKSMQGEELTEAAVGERGVAGDRAYALMDAETGRVASAKNPRRWGALAACRAALAATPAPEAPLPPVRITLPDGSAVSSDQPDVDARLSAAVGRRVVLCATPPEKPTIEKYWHAEGGIAPFGEPLPEAEPETDTAAVTTVQIGAGAPPGSFFDFAPLHLLTTTTLERLQEHYPAGRFDARRFRPNIVVATASDGAYPELSWVGRTLTIGPALQLRIVMPVARCVVTTLPRADLPEDVGILRTIVRYNRVPLGKRGELPCVGVYAQVLAPGSIHPGDTVRPTD